jgi:dGTPase
MKIDRKSLEELESQSLAPYGMQSSRSRGRAHPESEPAYRTCFQRDRDRILHTTAFRRLEHKTQVFITTEADYYRTRLTHTLEVAQIGRTIARALGANEDLVEAICLAHDMGHSPFGHSGEVTLDRLMKGDGGFDHNKQSLRIVDELEDRFPNFHGLNLTWEVREGIVKHESEYDQSDADKFNPQLRGHIEAQITNVADELAYTAHDLDDGLHSGIITLEALGEIEIWKSLTADLEIPCHDLEEKTRHRIIRRLIGLEVTDIIDTSDQNIQKEGIASVEELQRLPYNVVSFSKSLAGQNRQLKDFLFAKMYRHYRVVRMAAKAERVLTDLFTAYLGEPTILPDHIRGNFARFGEARTICDYIAGMTDRFAVEEHKRLFEPGVLP